MKLIDADILYRKLGWSARDCELAEIIEKIPTIDAVEVVRCKTCKYNVLGECAVTNMIHQDESFCSWGSGE